MLLSNSEHIIPLEKLFKKLMDEIISNEKYFYHYSNV